MRNILVALKSNPSKDDFESFMESLGGKWDHDPTLDQGVLQRKAATIYVDYFDTRTGYPLHELQALERILGGTPTAGANIHIGHAEGSEALAFEFAEQIITRWGGYLDDNENPVT